MTTKKDIEELRELILEFQGTIDDGASRINNKLDRILNARISEPCDCPHEENGCHYSGYCEHRKAPDKDLNGTWLPTCGVKFPDRKDGE